MGKPKKRRGGREKRNLEHKNQTEADREKETENVGGKGEGERI